MKRAIGVCSWSLQASDPRELVERIQAIPVPNVQLALKPIRSGGWSLEETVDRLRDAGVGIRSGMMSTLGEDYTSLETIRRTGGIRLDANWKKNRRLAEEDAAVAARLGVPLVSLHAGFLPHDRDDPERRVMIERLREIIDLFAAQNVQVALETGQESASTLLSVLRDIERDTVGVNFDPANMILYDMGDPIDALAALAPFVRQVHIKDAVRTGTPGVWGAEVPVGEGDVDWPRFFGVMDLRDLSCDLMIEREAGDDRVGDIAKARALVEELQS